MPYVLLSCRLALAGVMAIAAVTKLRSPGDFAASLAGFDFIPRRLRRPLAWFVPAAELLITVLLAVPETVPAGFAAALLFCCGLTAVPVLVLARGTAVRCACLGASDVPMDGWHVARNAVLLATAGLGVFLCLRLGAGLTAYPPGIALAVAAAAFLATLIVFTDDLAELFRSPAPAAGTGR